MSTDCVVMTIRTESIYGIKSDQAFGPNLYESISEFRNQKEPRKPVKVLTRSAWGNIAGWVIGTDSGEASQVYVVREGQGERITPSRGSQASLDALVDVLRSHGYTCRRSA